MGKCRSIISFRLGGSRSMKVDLLFFFGGGGGGLVEEVKTLGNALPPLMINYQGTFS